MPVTLLSMNIRGIRSYSPYEHKKQKIDFMPLTLIVGANGSGKTTVIESLRFIISGEEPPLSDSRRNFLHTSNRPKASFDKNTSYGSIVVEFTNIKNEICFAKRDISLPTAKGPPSISSSFKTGDCPWTDVHRKEDWNKTVPKIFNLPNQALLNNVVLCHQDENLWCMGESSAVKETFDRIFGCEQYKKEIKHIDAELKSCRNDISIAERELLYTKERVQIKERLTISFEDSRKQIEEVTNSIIELGKQLKEKKSDRISIKEHITSLEQKVSKLESLKQKAKELAQREKTLLSSFSRPVIKPEDVSDVELQSRVQNQENLVAGMKQQQSLIGVKKERLDSNFSILKSNRSCLQDKMNQLTVLELKSEETHESLKKSLENIKLEQSIGEIDAEDFEASFKILDRLEKDLLQNKSDQSELEDSLSGKQQKLSRALADLEGVHQGSMQKIKNKEIFIKKLSNQLAKAEPMVRDLLTISSNLEKMESIRNRMLKTDLVVELNTLISDTKQIVNNLIREVKDENIVNLNSEILKEEKDVQTCKERVKTLEEQKIKLSNQRSQYDSEHTQVRAASREAHNRAVVFKNAKSNILSIYTKYQQEKKLLSDKNRNLLVEELEKLDDSIKSIEKELAALDVEYSNISNQIGESFEIYEEYRINYQLRELMLEIEETAEQVISNGIEKEDLVLLKTYKSRLDSLEQEELACNRKQSKFEGTKLQLEKELHNIKLELKSHSKTNRTHAEVLGKMVCNKIILNDLEKLKECFKESIITFHNQMIVKINEVLKARWRQIYQGTDIDLIELVDEEITKGKDKKTFNYYLAMRKSGIRMKMREKSSAGQKALASIILRMTLAELFVKDFSFIALDEPTANLDLANVKSLAKAIGSYVKQRLSKGINIQWIIITHDENFLRTLDSECSQYYYRLELDDERCSKIVRISYQEFQNPPA